MVGYIFWDALCNIMVKMRSAKLTCQSLKISDALGGRIFPLCTITLLHFFSFFYDKFQKP